MRILISIILLLTFFFIIKANGQSLQLRLFQLDTVDNWFGSSRYYNHIVLDNNQIIHSFLKNRKFTNNLKIYGDVMIKTHHLNGTISNSYISNTDSLLISKIIPLNDGSKIILGQSANNISFYDLDTTVSGTSAIRSFIIHLSASEEVLYFKDFINVSDVTVDEAMQNIYFVDQITFNNALVYTLQIGTYNLYTLNSIENAATIPRILKTQDYIYIAGASIAFNVIVGLDTFPSQEPYFAFLLQLNNTGMVKWIKIIKDETIPHIDLAPAKSQGIYWASDLMISLNIGNDSILGPRWGEDCLIIHIDSSGNYQWAREMPNNTNCGFKLGTGFCLGSDAAYNVYLAGYSMKLIQWNDGKVVGRDTSIGTPTLLIYDDAGNLKNHIIANESSHGYFHSLSVAADGSFALSGKFNGTLIFDSISYTTLSNSFIPYFLYYTPESSNNLVNKKENARIAVYPNPIKAGEKLYINAAPIRPRKAILYNISGQVIQKYKIDHQTNFIHTPNIANGTYFLKFDTGNMNKIMIEK